MALKPEVRHQKILKQLRSLQQEISVEIMADFCKTTPSTIRRDLTVLEKEGAVIRTHGGAVAAEQAVFESEYHARVSKNFKLKQAIGKAAAEQVTPGGNVLVSDGSTNFHLATSLPADMALTVFTNSIEMISALSRNPMINIHIMGGKYNRQLHCMSGGLLTASLESLMFDTVYLGTDGIDAEGNCLTADPAEASIARLMLSRGRQKVLLADHTKVNGDGYTTYGNLAEFDTWVTSKGLKKKQLTQFNKLTNVVEV